MDWNLVIGFVLGIVTSGIASALYERATSPLVEISLDDRPVAGRRKSAMPLISVVELTNTAVPAPPEGGGDNEITKFVNVFRNRGPIGGPLFQLNEEISHEASKLNNS